MVKMDNAIAGEMSANCVSVYRSQELPAIENPLIALSRCPDHAASR
jgi:hypothetical protein